MRPRIYVAMTDPTTGDVYHDIATVIRADESGSVLRIVDTDGHIWLIRYDALRRHWVRATGQEDGAPVPPPQYFPRATTTT